MQRWTFKVMAAKHFDLFSLIFTAHISRQKQSIAPVRPKADWTIDTEAMRARGIIVLVKSN